MSRPHISWIPVVLLVGAVVLGALDWGLPSRERVDLLFEGTVPDSLRRLVDRASDSYFSLRDSLDAQGADARSDAGGLAYRPDPLPSVFSPADKLRILRRYLLGSCSVDERQPYIALARMHPQTWDFDPRGSPYGGAFLYPIGASLFLLTILGTLDADAPASHYIDHPEDVRDMYRVGRLFALLPFLGVLVLLGLFTASMRPGPAGILAASSWGISSIALNHALVTKPHMWTAFWVLLALYLLHRHCTANRSWSLLLSGVSAGIAIGSSLPAVCVLPAYMLSWPLLGQPKDRLQRLLVVSAVALAVSCLTNPYVVLNPVAHWATASRYAAGWGFRYSTPSAEKLLAAVRDLLVRGLPLPLGLVGAVGLASGRGLLGTCLHRTRLLWFIVLVVMGAFTGEARYVLYLGPVLCLTAGLTVDGMLRRVRGWVRGAVAIGFLAPGVAFGSLTVYDMVRDRSWIPATRSWLGARQGSGDRTSLGLMDHPEPQDLPPLPFLEFEIIGLGEATSAGMEPEFVLIGNRSGALQRWQEHPLRPHYALETTLGYRAAYDVLLRYRTRSEARAAAWVFVREGQSTEERSRAGPQPATRRPLE